MPTLAVVGSSVSLLVRPPRDGHAAGPYATLLRETLGIGWRVENLSRTSFDIQDAVETFRTRIVPLDPDVIILHLGINEASTRFLSRRLWRFANGGPDDRERAPGLARRSVLLADRIFRRPWTRAFRSGWFSPERFDVLLGQLLLQIEKETHAHVIVVGIGKPTERVERTLAGTSARAAAVDEILAAAAGRSDRITFIPTAWVAEDLDALQPDGIHLSAQGHARLADQLLVEIGRIKR